MDIKQLKKQNDAQIHALKSDIARHEEIMGAPWCKADRYIIQLHGEALAHLRVKDWLTWEKNEE